MERSVIKNLLYEDGFEYLIFSSHEGEILAMKPTRFHRYNDGFMFYLYPIRNRIGALDGGARPIEEFGIEWNGWMVNDTVDWHSIVHTHNTLKLIFSSSSKDETIKMVKKIRNQKVKTKDDIDDAYLFDSYNYQLDYHSKFPMVFLGNTGKVRERFFGIELEYDYLDEFVISDNGVPSLGWFKCESDGSLNDGSEFISQPFTEKYYQEKMKEKIMRVVNYANSEGGETGYRTGLHIHISRKSLSDELLCRLYYFLNADDNYKFIKSISGRDPNLSGYCQKSPEKGFDYRGKKSSKNLSFLNRYQILNVTNKQTVELRCFKSSTDYEEVLGRIEFTMALLHYLELTVGKFEKNINKKGFLKFAELNKDEYPNLSILISRI